MSAEPWRPKVLVVRPEDDGALGLALLFLIAAMMLLARDLWTPQAPAGLPVEVLGQVARPGWHLVDPPTLAAAVEAAGGIATGLPETPLVPGDAVQVDPEGVALVRASQPLLAGAPLVVGRDRAEAFAVLPDVGEKRAASFAPEAKPRRDKLPWQARKAVDAAGAAVAADPPRGPVDINTADAVALEELPGVGPSLARKILEDRAKNGPFRTVDDLDRVSGIGPSTIEKLRAKASVSSEAGASAAR